MLINVFISIYSNPIQRDVLETYILHVFVSHERRGLVGKHADNSYAHAFMRVFSL